NQEQWRVRCRQLLAAPSGQALQRAFSSLVAVLNARGVRYAIIGGIATIQHTRVRTTNDIDALVAIAQIAMPGLFEALRDNGFVVDLQRNMARLANQWVDSY
ncbi:MAG: hypothetical protein WA840_00895, partial [Caulobacteraceae bacterium]